MLVRLGGQISGNSGARIHEELSHDDTNDIPEHDDFVSRIISVISDLDTGTLTLETAFYLTREILEESPCPAEDIWESCRRELSRRELSLETLLFKARVECYLGTRYAVDALIELAGVGGNRPELLHEAALLRFRLAGDTAERLYDEERPKAKLEFDEAAERLRSLYRSQSQIAHRSGKEIKHARRAFERADSKLGKLKDEYYLEEVDEALRWARSAQEFDRDNPALCELVVRLQRAVIRTKMQSGMIRVDRVTLLNGIGMHFGEGGLRDICFALDVDYDSLPGGGKGDRARELILHLSRCGRLWELVEVCSRLRPKVSWWRRANTEGYLRSPKHPA